MGRNASPHFSSPLPSCVIAPGHCGGRKETCCRGKPEVGCVPFWQQRGDSAVAAAMPGKGLRRGTGPSPLPLGNARHPEAMSLCSYHFFHFLCLHSQSVLFFLSHVLTVVLVIDFLVKVCLQSSEDRL